MIEGNACPLGNAVLRLVSKRRWHTRAAEYELRQVAQELKRRLASLFLPDARGSRPWAGEDRRFAEDPHWRELSSFHEYYDGDTGRGLGASHFLGWTSLVLRCLEDVYGRPLA